MMSDQTGLRLAVAWFAGPRSFSPSRWVSIDLFTPTSI